MDPKHIAELRFLTGDPSRVILNPQVVEQLSRDFYWYSPVLRKQLDGKLGDVVVQPLGAAEIQNVLRYCYANNIPVTARGAGTGNYGQAVPLEGGVVLDLSRMDRIEEIQPEGVAVCQPGVRLGDLENEARKSGWELRCYPSTIIKASVGGFLGGGSGGIGSVAHGNAARLSNGARDRSGHDGAGTARRSSRRRSGPRNSACLGHQRHHHAHLAGADAGRGMVAVRRGVRYLRRGIRFQRANCDRRSSGPNGW